MKRHLVAGMESLCGWIDRIPTYRRGVGWTASQWGCWPLCLARRACELEQRWGTGGLDTDTQYPDEEFR